MPADDVPGAPSEPELDEYGVPIQRPPQAHVRLRLSGYIVGVAIQVAAALMYLRYEHQHSTAGIRITAAAAAVIGWLPRRWGEKSFGSARLGPVGLAVMTACILMLLAGTAVLLIEALSPHGLTLCHHNCGGGGY